jgi:hypothetical protein
MFRVPVLLICLAALAGCAGTQVREDSGKVVSERATARWNYLIQGDLEKAYGLISPTSRKTYPWDVYRGAVRAGFWKAVQVDKVNCPSSELCEVDVTIEYVAKGQTIRTPLRESWTKQEGQWWYVLKSL